MRVLAFDPGAIRCGYACLERGEAGHKKPPEFIGSGINGLERPKDEKYQVYRLRLIEFWAENTPRLLVDFKPEVVVTEIVPVVGGGNFVVATQSQLASTASTVIQTICYQANIPVEQIGATTVKKNIGGSNKATKVKVRNGVLALMPDQKERAASWKDTFDESDAFAIGLTYLGYKVQSGPNKR